MSWLMHGPQSWEIRVVCLIQVQKCIDLAHFIRLELELLRHRSFVTEWRSWLLCTMAILQYWEDGQRSSPKGQAAQNRVADWAVWSQLFLDEMKKECPGCNTACRGRSGACFYWNECSIMLQLCGIKSIRGTPGDSPRTNWDCPWAP